MKSVKQKVWEAMLAHGGYLSSVELAEHTNLVMPNVSSALTQLARTGLAEMRRDTEYSDKTARQKTTRRYKAVGSKFINKPQVALVPKTALTPLVSVPMQFTPPPLHVVAPEPAPNDYAEFLEYQAFQKFMAMKKQFTG